jgi:hypothetical protein
MKAGLLAAFAGALLALPAADAADWRQGRGLQLQAQGQPVKKAPKQIQRERGKAGGHDKRHHQRLTDEERRQLRQDIDRADREIYRR